MAILPLLTGASVFGQLQSGKLMVKSSLQEVIVLFAVMIRLLLMFMSAMVKDPPQLSTKLPSLTTILSALEMETVTV